MVAGRVIKIHLFRYLLGYKIPRRIEEKFDKYEGLRRIREKILIHKECPICGKKYQTLQGILGHLRASTCMQFFDYALDGIIKYLYEKELQSKQKEVSYNNVAKLLNEEIERYLVH